MPQEVESSWRDEKRIFRGLFYPWRKWPVYWTWVPSGPSLARVGGVPRTLPYPVHTAVRALAGEQAAGPGPGPG